MDTDERIGGDLTDFVNEMKPKTVLGMICATLISLSIFLSCCGASVDHEKKIEINDPTNPIQNLHECLNTAYSIQAKDHCHRIWSPIIETYQKRQPSRSFNLD